jgi:hypothetical protein
MLQTLLVAREALWLFLLLVLKNEAARYRGRLFVVMMLLQLLLPTSLVSSSKGPAPNVFKILLLNEINKTMSSTTPKKQHPSSTSALSQARA